MTENLDHSRSNDIGVLEIFGTQADARMFDELVDIYNFPDRDYLIFTSVELMQGMLEFLPDCFIPTARDVKTDDHAIFFDRIFLPFMPQYKKEIEAVEACAVRVPKHPGDDNPVVISRLAVNADDIAAIEKIVDGYKGQEFADILFAMVGFIKFTSKQKVSSVPSMFNEEGDGFVVLDFPELHREVENEPILPSKDAASAANALLTALRAGGPCPK